jgi:hypothetical protein
MNASFTQFSSFLRAAGEGKGENVEMSDREAV